MYSKNDYRYYLEHRMAEENYLAHYGVKGMKWHKHIKGEIDNIKYDLQQRQIGEVAKGNTVYDPQKNVIINRNNKARKLKHPNESSMTTNYRDWQSGDYKIKKRTSRSNLFKAINKVTKNGDTSSKEQVAERNRAAKKQTYKRMDDGYKENRESHVTTTKYDERGDQIRRTEYGSQANKTARKNSSNTKKKAKNPLAPKNQKVEITELKNTKTGEKYKSSKKPSKKIKNPLAPKNQKVEIITNKKKKRSKREAKWNKKMQNYGREILSEQKR